MRRRRQLLPRPGLLYGLALVSACGWAATGCSDGGNAGRAGSPPASSSARPSSLPRAAVGVSPGGVTTRVDVPAESTEEEYFQACHAAKLWMDGQGSTGETAIEPYLRMVQTAAAGVAGTWNQRWADLGAARQAGVIVAAEAAARGECG